MNKQDEQWPELNDPEQTRVLHAFLRRYKGVPGNWIEENVPGITANDMSRWRNGKGEWMSGDKFQAVRRALHEGDLLPPDLEPPSEDGGSSTGRESV